MPTVTRASVGRLLVVMLLVTACNERKSSAPIVAGGDAERGRAALKTYGCGSCHTIPGVRGARGLVGPSLQETGLHMYIGGVLPNDPENIVRWIINPPAVDPKTAMPALGVTDRDARDMAEYIYQLAKNVRRSGG
jgi:cytochrome c